MVWTVVYESAETTKLWGVAGRGDRRPSNVLLISSIEIGVRRVLARDGDARAIWIA